MAKKKHVPINRDMTKHLLGKKSINTADFTDVFACRRDRCAAYKTQGYVVVSDIGSEHTDLVMLGRAKPIEPKKKEPKKDK